MQLVKFTLPLAILAVLVSSAPVPSSNEQDVQSNVHMEARGIIEVDYDFPSKQADKRGKGQVHPSVIPNWILQEFPTDQPGSSRPVKNFFVNGLKAIGQGIKKIVTG